MLEQVRRILSGSLIQAEVERFLIELRPTGCIITILHFCNPPIKFAAVLVSVKLRDKDERNREEKYVEEISRGPSRDSRVRWIGSWDDNPKFFPQSCTFSYLL
jgi:hypothetical protein